MSVELFTGSPTQLPPWMNHLERAHGLAHAAARAIEDHAEPSLHLEPAARRLEHGLVALYDAFDGRTDRPTAIVAAHARLWDAAVLVARAGLPAALAALREACGELVAAEERFPRVALPERATDPLRAGTDVPPLHFVERPSLAPSFRTPPLPEPEDDAPVLDLPEPKTFEELAAAAETARRFAETRAKTFAARKAKRGAKKLPPAPLEPPPGFALVPAPALDDDGFVRRWARECFEEIGMLGVQRAPLPGDDWRSCHTLEKRLVHAIDAIAALGPTAIAHVEALALDAPVANPMSVHAIAMIGGCLDGRDALACAERVLYRFGPSDPNVAAPFAAAMKLAPSPFVRGALRSLLRSSELGCRAIAVEVLAYRGWLEPGELAELGDEEDPHLFALALPALAAARHPDFRRAVSRALADGDVDVQIAALAAMALAAHPEAAAAARTALTGPAGELVLVPLAIVGGAEDARWLLDHAKASPTPAAVQALGWAGSVEAVPLLLGLLEAEDDAVKLTAGAALDRMLGANLVESIEVMPEDMDDVEVVDPDPEPTRPRRPLAELVSHPRDMPSQGSSETLEVATADPAAWRAYWNTHGRRFDPQQRLRRGQPYSPSVSLYELDRLALSPEDRRRLHGELAARTGRITHFDPHDFVLVQEQSLAAWGALVRGTIETPGSWARPPGR